jgi:hypothetical protein
MRPIFVTNANDSGAGSLRQALRDADINGAGHDDILFDDAFFSSPRTINLTTASLGVFSSLNMIGPGANRLTVRRDFDINWGVFDIFSGFDVYLSGLTIKNGDNSSGGGGIESSSNLTLTGVAIIENTGTGGGGLELQSANGRIIDSTISNNIGTTQGSGVLFGASGHYLLITNSTLTQNTGPVGAIFARADLGDNLLEMTNSVFDSDDNVAVRLTSLNGSNQTANLENSIFTGDSGNNLVTSPQPDSSAAFSSLGHNISNGDDAAHLSQGSDQVLTEPLLGPLANNGGQTPTHMPLDGSPVFDKGSCTGNGSTLDQRGYARPFDRPGIANSDDACDIGPVEWVDWNGDGIEDFLVYFFSGFE